MSSWINLSALWKILVFGLLAGAGLPALFAAGLYSLSRGPRTAHTAGAAGTDSDVLVGGSAGVIIVLIILAALAALIYYRAHRSKVDQNNVNAEWTGTVTPVEPEPAAAA